MVFSTDTVAIIAITFSTIGFAISMAIPTLIPSALRIIQEKMSDAELLLESPVIRLISKFGNMKWVVFYYTLALLYLLTGFLIILNYFTGYDLVPFSMIVLLVTVATSMGGTFWLILCSTILRPKEINKVAEYVRSGKKRIKTSANRRKSKDRSSRN